MLILGLTGAAGAGKDTVADYLSERYGFVKLAFAGVLRQEVQKAFGLPDQSLFHDRALKEEPTSTLSLSNCLDEDFVRLALPLVERLHHSSDVSALFRPLSPRRVLQWWGTEYRRAQDGAYWVESLERCLHAFLFSFVYPEHRPTRFVITDCRFENERAWVHDLSGNVWHIHRDAAAPVASHVTTQALPALSSERELWNNDTVERLHGGVDLLMTTSARFVRVEPLQQASGTCSYTEYLEHAAHLVEGDE